MLSGVHLRTGRLGNHGCYQIGVNMAGDDSMMMNSFLHTRQPDRVTLILMSEFSTLPPNPNSSPVQSSLSLSNDQVPSLEC